MDSALAEPSVTLAAPEDVGALGIRQLKRYWSRAALARQGRPVHVSTRERHQDFLAIHASGLGWEQTIAYLGREAPDFAAFERWIAETTGGIAPERVARLNAALAGADTPDETKRWLAGLDAMAPVLSADDLAFWDEHGYVVLHDAVPVESREAATQALWDHIGARADDPETWYGRRDHGIMVQYFQHPAFEANRRSVRIHKAFAQLWGTADLWVTTDRVGFNVPEREGWRFPGPDLHWDISLKTPIPLGMGGILYLTDTPDAQGAFTLVPGFHRRVEGWLKSLPQGADPRREDLHALGSRPVGGRAGDLVIWRQELPHGSRPNRGTRPRMVQYIAMFPTLMDEQDEWI
jgi:hypothetical protein